MKINFTAGLFALAFASLFTLNSCQQENLTPSDDGLAIAQQQTKMTTDLALRKGKIIHHVSVGGPDFSGPGGNANFSLVANMDADGNVTGNWSDQFGHGDGGFHIKVDCLTIIGNSAIVGGVITHGVSNGVDYAGQRAVTAVTDNGKSAKDAPDQISYTYFG